MNEPVMSASEVFDLALAIVDEKGSPLDSRIGGCQEVIGEQMVLGNPLANWTMQSARKLSPMYAAGELLWYLSGSNDGAMIRHYAPSYEGLLSADGTAFGAYGARWARQEQLQNLVKLLQRDPNTRQAVLAIWNGDDLRAAQEGGQKDLPCTLSLQFFIRQRTLHAIATMRSNDIWLGLPYDVFCFTTIQVLLANILGVEVGWYTHQVGSLHLYDKNEEGAAACQKEGAHVDDSTEVSLFPKPNTLHDISVAAAIELEMRTGVILHPFSRLERTNLRGTLLGQLAVLAAMQSMSPSTFQGLEKELMEYVHPTLLWRAMAIRQGQKR